jgi:hypothetical protein
MSGAHVDSEGAQRAWREIALDDYERHMADPKVGQLQQLREITREQVRAYAARRIGVLGVAGGNGLDAIDPRGVEAVYGYDVNPSYLQTCLARYSELFGDRLHAIEAAVGGSLVIEPVDLVIANLIVEYVGEEEFAAFVAANAASIGVLSCVLQQGSSDRFVSTTRYAASLDGLASVSSEVDAESFASAMTAAGFGSVLRREYPLPNGKALLRFDFASRAAAPG